MQLAIVALVTVTPFIRIRGISLLRLDIPALTMELAGHRFRIEELYLVWLAALGFILLFILMALTLGRVWCGWACPQTILSDLSEWLIKKKLPGRIRSGLYLLASLWAGATVVWYFLSPYEFLERLASGRLGVWPIGTLLTVATLTLINLLWVRRLFCREFCPYGRFQTVLTDNGTLTIQAQPAHLQRCLNCNSCLKVCPTGIDIRRGFQIECISCGRCLDACRRVMAKRGEEGIIRYTFGQADLGWRSLLTVKTVGLALLVATIGATALFLASHRATASFRIGRSALVASRLTEEGRQHTFFSGSITNRRETVRHFSLTAAAANGEPLIVKGPTHFTLAGNEKRSLNLAIDSPAITGPGPQPITFRLLTAEDGSRLEIDAYLAPAEPTGRTSTKR